MFVGCAGAYGVYQSPDLDDAGPAVRRHQEFRLRTRTIQYGHLGVRGQNTCARRFEQRPGLSEIPAFAYLLVRRSDASSSPHTAPAFRAIIPTDVKTMSMPPYGATNRMRTARIHRLAILLAGFGHTRILNNSLGYQTSRDPEETGFPADLIMEL